MAESKKFGTFSGVFTPSILTILGVILYMRMGWVVGNAGLVGAIVIVVIAHVISVSTGLSVSSIATDKKVGAGGIYYILSRSMGIPIGGAIGLALYVGTAFSIALYLIGFAESFNGYFGLDTGINGLRISGSAGLLVLTAIALISTSVALKTQFFILTAIIISLISIFMGSAQFAPAAVAMVPAVDSAPLEIVFAIFFPAVTGFTAGTAMSGNLKDPKKSIPIGTIGAIVAGFAVYIGLAFFLAYVVNSEMLRNDYNVLLKIAYFSPAVVAGIWGATLSSALGGILGGPRILQAMSIDKITPRIFGRGRGKENEPINALILVFIIAQAGILIGELDVIARVVSMFYLAAYGFINISFYLESWANPDFQPSFRVNRWIGLIGFVACFGVMFKLDMIAMFASIVVIVGIHFWLQRKQIELEAGNVWNSVWEKIVAKGLNKLETKETKGGKWNPNIILFSGESEHRPYLLELSKTISGKTGIVTNFNLIKRGNGDTTITKTEQTIKDETFEELGIFGRKIEVDDIYDGIENVATTFGFSGIDPNTVMMGWTKSPEILPEFAKMTQSLIKLDYNILFLDFNKKTKFGNKQTVDIWLQKTDSKNAEMMLNIARFIVQSPSWSKVKIRVLFVNNEPTDNLLIKSEITKLLERLRVNADIKVISNNAEKKDLIKILELESLNTDLVVMGIPEGEVKEHIEFVQQTDEVFKVIGTTLLVKASNMFNRLDFDFSYDRLPNTREELNLKPLPLSEIGAVNELVKDFDDHLSETTRDLVQGTLSNISSLYMQFVEDAEQEIGNALAACNPGDAAERIASRFKASFKAIIRRSDNLTKNKLPSSNELLEKGIYDFVSARNRFLDRAEKIVKIELPDSYPGKFSGRKSKIYWRSILSYYLRKKILTNTRNSLYYLGVRNFSLVNKLAALIARETHQLIENLATGTPDALSIYEKSVSKVFKALKEECVRLDHQALISLSTYERDTCSDLTAEIDDPEFNKRIRKLLRRLNTKETLRNELNVSQFAGNWISNQESAHRQAEADFDLLIAGLSIFGANERIKNYINNTVIKSLENKIDILAAAAEYVRSDSDGKKTAELDARELVKLAEGIDYINFSNILDREEADILSISGSTRQSVELMSTGSFKSMLKNQDEGIESITLGLADIQDYLIQESYLSPLQATKKDLAKISNEIAEEIYYSATLISHVVENPDEGGKSNDSRDIAKEVQRRVESCRERLTAVSESFSHEITTNLQSTVAALTIGHILESSDTYTKKV
ncbi:MAG: amino acid permease, partial [Acidobacteriota bacterium]|nr:amino acid permease [Acidobacteriota bacterium]